MRLAACALFALLALSACGADGEPERPEDARRIDNSGTVGVSGRL